MKQNTFDNNLEEVVSFLDANFNQLSDIEGIILKGHILLEHQLDIAISKEILNKNEYESDKFSFSQKVIIGNMLGICRAFKASINALNKLRNQIAHSLKYEEELMIDLLKPINKKYSFIKVSANDLPNLKKGISAICYGISVQTLIDGKSRSIAQMEEELALLKKEIQRRGLKL